MKDEGFCACAVSSHHILMSQLPYTFDHHRFALNLVLVFLECDGFPVFVFHPSAPSQCPLTEAAKSSKMQAY